MKILLVGLVGLIFTLPAIAESIDAPTVKAGDSWTFQNTREAINSSWKQTHDVITVSRVTSTSIYYTSKQLGSTLPEKEFIRNLDWSRIRDVNGKQTVVNRPLNFPLEVGKTWQIQYTELNPNKFFRSQSWDSHYKVVGYETVEVPAGKFKACKIEAEGTWTGEIEPSQTAVSVAQSHTDSATSVSQISKIHAATKSGRTYKAFWYAPEIKSLVKTVEEYYNSNNIRTECYTSELQSFKLAD